MKKSELVATIIFRIMVGIFWAFILYKLPPLTPRMAVILLLMSTVILGYACGGDWLAIKLFKALTSYTIGGSSTQSQNSADPAAPATANAVSYTDLWSFDEINAVKCTERLLPLPRGEVGRGSL